MVVVGLVGCGLSSDYRTTPVNFFQLCTGLGCGKYSTGRLPAHQNIVELSNIVHNLIFATTQSSTELNNGAGQPARPQGYHSRVDGHNRSLVDQDSTYDWDLEEQWEDEEER